MLLSDDEKEMMDKLSNTQLAIIFSIYALIAMGFTAYVMVQIVNQKPILDHWFFGIFKLNPEYVGLVYVLSVGTLFLTRKKTSALKMKTAEDKITSKN